MDQYYYLHFNIGKNYGIKSQLFILDALKVNKAFNYISFCNVLNIIGNNTLYEQGVEYITKTLKENINLKKFSLSNKNIMK